MKNIFIFLSLLVLVFVLIGVYLRRNKGWKCSEGSCTFVLNGEYKNEEECKSKCKEEESVLLASLKDNQSNMNYACTSDYKCIQADQGNYTSKQNCQVGCNKPQQTTYSYPYNYSYPYSSFYPQSLYYNRPRYNNFRSRGIRGIKGGGRRGGGH
jgi:hypothetical protein